MAERAMHAQAESNAPGSQQYPFKLLIVGGGPAGISILVRAIRIGVIQELLSGDAAAGLAGVCLMEQGSSEQLGGGNLQHYQINSNTYAYKFFTNVVKENRDVVPPESTAGTPLESLLESNTGRALDLLGRRPAPLSRAGKFLCEVAHCVRAEMQTFETSACMTRTRMTKLERVNSELWKVSYQKPASPSHAAAAAAATTDEHFVFARHVVLATGGLQRAPQLTHSAHQAKLMLSDHMLSANGLRDLRNRIGQAPSFRKIVIVGGSHSAFSAAWVCLNRLQTSSGVKDDGVHLGPNSICIVHRRDIQVYYNSAREAEKDGYTMFDRTNSQGQVFPFGGLRGDAKDLYTAVRKGRENRVRLFKVGDNDEALITRLYTEATVIIWACGYETRIPPILDEHGNAIQVRYDKGQVEVDDDANIMLDEAGESPVGRLYGVGLGYGLKATLTDGTADGASGRADGFAVYLKRAATLVLASVVGPKVFGDGNNTWQERREALLRRCIAPDSPRVSQEHESFITDDGKRASSPLRRSLPLGSPTAGRGRSTLPSPDRLQLATMQRLSRPRERRGSQTEAAAAPPSKSLQPRARSLPPARGRTVNQSQELLKPISLRPPSRGRERHPDMRPPPDSPPTPRTAPVNQRRPSHPRIAATDVDGEIVKAPTSSPGPLVLARVRRHVSGGSLIAATATGTSAAAAALHDSPRGVRAAAKHVRTRSSSNLPLAPRDQSLHAMPPSPTQKEAYKLPKQVIGGEVGPRTPLSPSLTRRAASVDRASRHAARRKLQPVAAVPAAAPSSLTSSTPTLLDAPLAATAANTMAGLPSTSPPPSEPVLSSEEPPWEAASPLRASLERFPPAIVETTVR